MSPWSLWPLALTSIAYLLALGAATLLTARHLHDVEARLWIPAAFGAMHLGWGIGFWHGLGRVIGRRFRLSGSAAGSPR